MTTRKFVADFVKRNKYKYIIGILFVLTVDIFQLIMPRIIGYITDDMQNPSITMDILLKYIGIILLVSLGVMVFRYLYRIYITGTEKNWSMS